MNDKTILLVEDSSDDEALTLRALKKNNICNEVIVAHDGAEALNYLRGKGNGLPDLVLLDLKLPKANALEVLRHVRTEPRTRLLPVVILTTSGKKQDVINGYHLGVNSYIRKPANFGQFTEAVHKLGLYWLMLNESPPSQQRLP
jgi:CheY-like chemotaxis protein